MPIKIPDNLPAQKILNLEGVPLISTHDAMIQDIRPLKIAILNLMPDKIKTETQLARLLGHSPLQIELTLMKVGSYRPKNSTPTHLANFYQDWQELAQQNFDGLIITGAPVETLEFAEVKYWQELTEIFDWSLSHAAKIFTICWGGQAALYHFYGLRKHRLEQKCFGIYPHRIADPAHALIRGINDTAPVPVSRHTETRQSEIDSVPHLKTILYSDAVGPCLVEDGLTQYIYMFNHLEYDSETLLEEYRRDREAGKPITVPVNYFPDDDPEAAPVNSWRSTAHLLFRNWIDEIYKAAPFDLDQLTPRQLLRDRPHAKDKIDARP